jgi:hypothetical protein
LKERDAKELEVKGKERKKGENRWLEGRKSINVKYMKEVNCRGGECIKVGVKAYRPFIFPNKYL